MTNEYEIADSARAPLIYEKHQLLAPMGEGMLRAPLPMADGTDDSDYYRGRITGPDQSQRDYVAARDGHAQDRSSADHDDAQEAYR